MRAGGNPSLTKRSNSTKISAKLLLDPCMSAPFCKSVLEFFSSSISCCSRVNCANSFAWAILTTPSSNLDNTSGINLVNVTYSRAVPRPIPNFSLIPVMLLAVFNSFLTSATAAVMLPQLLGLPLGMLHPPVVCVFVVMVFINTNTQKPFSATPHDGGALKSTFVHPHTS